MVTEHAFGAGTIRLVVAPRGYFTLQRSDVVQRNPGFEPIH